MTDIDRIWEIREERRRWAERYARSSPQERAAMLRERRAHRDLWRRVIDGLTADPSSRAGRILSIPSNRRAGWLRRAWRRLVRRLS